MRSLFLPLAREVGLARVLLVCGADNVASCRVIAANGGVADGSEPNPHRPDVSKLRFWIGTDPRGA